MQLAGSRSRSSVCGFVIGSFLVFGSLHASAQTTVNYIGPNEGSYNLGANWDLGVVPINDLVDTFNVVIPASMAVNFDILGTSEITALSVDTSSTLRFLDGQGLEVLGVSVISGTIDATGPGAVFLSGSEFATFAGDRPRAFAKDGAVIAIAAPIYLFTANLGDVGLDLLVADGI